jgi:chromosome segregation ATPase
METGFNTAKLEIPETSSLVNELQNKIQEKEKTIMNYEEKYNKLLEDFNYNVSLIYERDKEIDRLNGKIDDLLMASREKDIQLVSMQSLYTRVKQLESDKVILTGRVEALMNSNNIPRPGRKSSQTPKPEGSPVISKHKRGSSVDKLAPVGTPLSRINMDLEKRIQALEQETDIKKEPLVTKENINSKEKEISELIKSLSPYKKEAKKSLGNFELEMNGFLRDVRKIREGISRSSSRSGHHEDSLHVPLIRSFYMQDKAVN